MRGGARERLCLRAHTDRTRERLCLRAHTDSWRTWIHTYTYSRFSGTRPPKHTHRLEFLWHIHTLILGSLHKLTRGSVAHTRNTTGRGSPAPPAMRMWDDVPCLGGWQWVCVGCSGFRGLSSGGGWSRAWRLSLALPAALGVCSHTSPPRGAPNCIRACSYTCTHSRIQTVGAHTYMCTWVGHTGKVRHQEGGSPRKQAAARGPAGAQRGPLSRSPRARLKTRCARPPAAAHAQGQRTGKRQCARGSASTATSTAWVGRMAHKEGDHLESLGVVDPRRHAAGRERRVDERQIPACV